MVQTAVTALLMSIATLTQMSVRDACEAWLETRRHHISPRTFQDYGKYSKIIGKYFDGLLITDLDGDSLRAYQRERSLRACPETINKELGMLLQVRARINRPITDYQRMRQKKDYESVGRALSPSEEAVWERVLKAAADHHSWDGAALCSLLSLKTGMGPGEILSLKIKDVVFGNPSYAVVPPRGAKRVRRQRAVVLIDDAEWAAKKLVKRAETKCGASSPDHFLVPWMNKDHSYDPTRPAKGFWESFEKLQAVAGVKFRIYDMRHHAVSKALNDPRVSLSAATLHFGHISQQMKSRYYHADLDTLRVVAAAIGRKPA